MYDTARYLQFAVKENIPCFEIRYGTEVPAELLTQWSSASDRILSIHLPDLCGRDGSLRTESLKNAVQYGLDIGCRRMTLHVPGFAVRLKRTVWDNLLDAAAEVTELATSNGCKVGWENMHMTPGEKADENRSYGYTVEECREWIFAVRERVGNCRLVGFHFDIGHAWNNAPYSETQGIEDWLRELGGEMNGCHLHQISIDPVSGKYINHMPLTGISDGLVSLQPLIDIWESTQKPPLFLEIRGEMACAKSYLALRH